MAEPAMSSAGSKINTYHLLSSSGPSIIAQTLHILRSSLPVSLPVYRRLQSGRFFDATILLTNLTLGDESPATASNTTRPGSRDDEPWFLAFVDRSVRPETEGYVFGSWEVSIVAVDSAGSSDAKGDVQTAESSTEAAVRDPRIDALMRSLLAEVKTFPVPTSIHADPPPTSNAESGAEEEKDSVGHSRTEYGGHAANPNIMLWGAVHERTTHVLKRLGVMSDQFTTGFMPNWTFVWDVDELRLRQETNLPAELRWADVRHQDIALVRSRTQIPRQERTMKALPSLGIYPVDQNAPPVAWALVGLDGSLTSLHVEPEWRGRGLAKATTVKLFTEKNKLFWEEGTTRWAHGYVIVGNKQSEGMCRSLGGRSDYTTVWARVDLAKV